MERPYFDPEQAVREAKCLDQRLGQQNGPSPEEPAQRISDSLGLALSGGGIRSATFNLGLLQSLAGAGRLKQIDYLSTVSGGGYIGGFLGRLFHRAQVEKPGETPQKIAQDVERKLASDEAPIIRWLRDNGRYLAPHGSRDRFFAAAIYLRNMLSVHVILGVIFLCVFVILAWVRAFHYGLYNDGVADATDLGQVIFSSPSWRFAITLAIFFLTCAWAYWMLRRRPVDAGLLLLITLVLGAGAAYVLLFSNEGCPPLLLPPQEFWQNCQAYARSLLLVAAIALPAPIVAFLVARRRTLAQARNTLSWLSSKLLLSSLAFAALALLDDFASCLAAKKTAELSLLGAGIAGAFLTALRTLAARLSTGVSHIGNTGIGRGLKGLIGAAGLLLLLLVALGWAVAAYALAGSEELTRQFPHHVLALAAFIILVSMFFVPWGLDFLNLSSLHQFYAARLTRAYLGAGNPARNIAWAKKPTGGDSKDDLPVSDVVDGDDMSIPGTIAATALATYEPHAHGGPLHLINVNINQTRFSAAGDFQPDRKGRNMAVGPAGFNLGRTFWQPTSWENTEALTLGCWLSISGAAFSTGAGPRTGLGFSALLGLLGVRLGYWWQAGATAPARKARSAARLLLNEFTGNFDPDKSTSWYLSDGGHFENTGAYELIRRRIKRILVADCGADPNYGFEDISNLVLKARIDFGAEIEFLGTSDLDALWNHSSCRKDFSAPVPNADRSGAPLMLARVRYLNDPVPGWLLAIKPRLAGELPADLARYARSEPDFPQQTTLDQFYDESQWESTRKLGRLIGERLVEALTLLPEAWSAYLALNRAFAGANWNSVPKLSSGEPAQAGTGTAKLVALYTPIVIALWTGFEFYANYQRAQEAKVEEQRTAQEAAVADQVKFILSRIDMLEQWAKPPSSCGSGATDCPTAAGQIEILKEELDELTRFKPNKAKSLRALIEELEAALGLGKPDRFIVAAEGVDMAKSAPPQTRSPQPNADTNLEELKPEKALVYIQIYTENTRPRAQDLIASLVRAGMKKTQLPGIENVIRTAQVRGDKAPARFGKPTLIHYHPKDWDLANWIKLNGLTDYDLDEVNILDLSEKYKNVRPGLIEVWLPERIKEIKSN